MGTENNKLIGEIIECNLSTETKIKLINKITEKSHISGFILDIALRVGLGYIIDKIEL